MSATIDPALAHRRSQLYRWHTSHGAIFVAHGDAVFVDCYDIADEESVAMQRLGICDLSLLPRDGLTGPGSTALLNANQFQIPERANTSVAQHDGDLLMRLSAQEYLRLGLSILSPDSNAERINWTEDAESQAYAVPRADSHCLFAVSGSQASAMFSKLCGIDFRPDRFHSGAIAQTSVARVNAIVVRHDLGSMDNFYLLAAAPAAEYLWECVLDAMIEFDGKPVGITALRQISVGQA